ncbi:MAG: helix-turn-helix transcriptional regulator [Beduini sp.]|uniref:helix-turn-helix transcriptional regulator n=1 Tax=Beduini sp. TaxID=1922300 RepID=UPI0039A08E85
MNKKLFKAKLVEKGITQKELAKARGCTLNTINRIVNGHIKMSTEDAVFFCNILGIANDEEKCKIFLNSSSQKRDEENIL